MSENATHVEGLEFRATDVNASAVADKIGSAFHRLHHAAEVTKEKIGETAREMAHGALAAVGLSIGLGRLYEASKQANIEQDRVRKSVAGAQFGFQGWKSGISQIDKMTYSMKQSVDVVEELEAMEVNLRTPLEDLGQTFSQVASLGYSKLGMNQKQVVELTEQMTAAAKVYGISGSEAVSTVTRGLMMGKIRGFGPFQMAMKEALDLKSGKQKGPLNTEEMFKKLERSLKGMVPVARKVGDNFTGSMFEARALVNKMMEELGGPLFREQSKALSEWVQKIRTVKEDGKGLVTIYGEKIASAFNTIKSATTFIFSHWKLLFGMYAASKMSSAFGGWSKGGASGHGEGGGFGTSVGAMNVTASVVNVNGAAASAVGNAVSAATQPAVRSLGSRLAGLASKSFLAAEALGGLYIGLQGAAKMLDEWQTKDINNKARWGSGSALAGTEGTKAARHMEGFRDLLNGGGFKSDWRDGAAKAKEAMTSYQAAYGADVISKIGAVNKQMALQAWQEMGAIAQQKQASGLGLGSNATGQQFVDKLGEMVKMLAGLLPSSEEFSPNKRKGPKSPDINIGNITITQDFKEADPNRVFHKITNEIAGLASSPGTSKFHVRGGF
jgi:hypothetical protein